MAKYTIETKAGVSYVLFNDTVIYCLKGARRADIRIIRSILKAANSENYAPICVFGLLSYRVITA